MNLMCKCCWKPIDPVNSKGYLECKSCLNRFNANASKNSELVCISDDYYNKKLSARDLVFVLRFDKNELFDAMITYFMSKGMTKEEAEKEFIEGVLGYV